MPSAQPLAVHPSIRGGNEKARPRITQPITYSGSLDSFKQIDSTPTVGREIPDLQIKKLLSSPDSDTLIRDLAITGKYQFTSIEELFGYLLLIFLTQFRSVV